MGEKIKTKVYYYDICIIGAGGTGSYFLKEVSRYIAGLSKTARKKIGQMYIVDGDFVEEKNLNRQSFMPEDIGRNKAAVMTEILNEAFGLSYKCIDKYLLSLEDFPSLRAGSKEENMYKEDRMEIYIPILIGCVDNHACRILCEEYFEKAENCIYFDSANELTDGECVFAYKKNGIVKAPVRSYYFPDIRKGDLRNVSEMSCEELNSVEPQHIFTNMYASMQLLVAFRNLIEHNVVMKGWSYFDTLELINEFHPYKELE